MYRLLFLFFAVTLMACDNDTPQEKPHEQEKHEVPVPVSKPQFDEVGERIWYGRTPAMRLDSTDYGAGLTSVFGMRTSSIPKQRFDSLFKQTVWEIKDIRVVETDLSLAKKNPGIQGWVTTTEFTCRNGVIVLHRQGINVNHVDTVNYVYDEVGNEIVLEGTGIKMVCAAAQQKCSRIFAARSHHVGTFRLVLRAQQRTFGSHVGGEVDGNFE